MKSNRQGWITMEMVNEMDNDIVMSVDEVARYLKLSVHEINALVQKKELPGIESESVLRFNRLDIQRWAEARLERNAGVLPEAISIGKILDISRIRIFDGILNKHATLEAMIDCFSMVPGLENRKEIEDAVFYRERLMSTGIGLGVAVPHVRLQIARSLSLAVGICKHGVVDYDSLDGQPVRILMMVIAGKGQHQDYIRLLAYLSSILKNNQRRQALIDAESPSLVFELLINKAL